jgi:hypothetical protein
MNNLWTISIIETGLVVIENGCFTCIADSAQNLERQLECNGFSRAEILEVFLQLSAWRAAKVNVAPNPINIRQISDAKVASFSHLLAR